MYAAISNLAYFEIYVQGFAFIEHVLREVSGRVLPFTPACGKKPLLVLYGTHPYPQRTKLTGITKCK